jgi:hypothetical protein
MKEDVEINSNDAVVEQEQARQAQPCPGLGMNFRRSAISESLLQLKEGKPTREQPQSKHILQLATGPIKGDSDPLVLQSLRGPNIPPSPVQTLQPTCA